MTIVEFNKTMNPKMEGRDSEQTSLTKDIPSPVTNADQSFNETAIYDYSSGDSYGFSPTAKMELDDALPDQLSLKSASATHGSKQIKIEVSDSNVPVQKHAEIESSNLAVPDPKHIKIKTSDSDEPDQKHIIIESSDSDLPFSKHINIKSSDSKALNSKHIRIESSDSVILDPMHITIEDWKSDASLVDLPILEPPKKIRRGYECEQESDFLPEFTSSPAKQFTCEPTEMDADSPTVVIPMSTSYNTISKDYTSTVELHNGSVPIYSKPSKSLTSKEIVELCVGEVEDTYICKTKPVSVRFNAVFFIDLHKVDMKSLYADDNGVWKTACPKSHLNVCFNKGKVEHVEISNAVNYTHFIKRQYGTHQGTLISKGVTFQRIISAVTSKNNNRCRYAVIQYIHRDGTEQDVVLQTHGNAKKQKQPFLKSDPSVHQSVKDDLLETKPRRLFKTLVDQAGGPLYSKSAASEPRNMKQIYNIRASQRQKPDDFLHFVSQLKDDSFVRNFCMDSRNVEYILANEKQLNDMRIFCTNPFKFSVFSFDSTFDIGNYYVTTTCFQNLKVVHTAGPYRGKYPFEIGPTFIHTNREANNFVNFFEGLKKMNSEFKDIQAFGSDGDLALLNAVAICYLSPLHVTCSDHKKSNIETKLREYKATKAATKHIISDIFGRKLGSVFEKGLIDSEDKRQFDKYVRDFKATWDNLVPTFHTWFIANEAELFKSHLIREQTRSARLEESFSNNRTESINNNIKDWIGRTGNLSFPVVNNKIKDIVEAQQQEFEMSIYASGSYELSDSYLAFRKERHIWNGLPSYDRQKALDKFWSAEIGGEKPHTSSVRSVARPTYTTDTEVLLRQENKDEVLVSGVTSPKLSVSHDTVNLVGLSENFLEEIWLKSEALLLEPDSVAKAPGFDGYFVRHSVGKNLQPHLVTVGLNGKVTCNDCVTYKGLKLCQHALCVAEKMGMLKKYLDWRQKSKQQVNITSVVMGEIESGHKGKKVSKPRKGGRTPIEKERPEQEILRQAIVADLSVKGTLESLENIDDSHPFELIYLYQTRASLCYGCGVKFVREKEQNTLIVRHFCERDYVVHGQKKTKYQYAYFHLKSTCARKKFPEFKKEQLKISGESKAIILAEIIEKLKAMGIEVDI